MYFVFPSFPSWLPRAPALYCNAPGETAARQDLLADRVEAGVSSVCRSNPAADHRLGGNHALLMQGFQVVALETVVEDLDHALLTHGFQVVTLETVVKDIDIIVTLTGNFSIVRLEHMKQMKSDAIMGEHWPL